jgi:hypothetical protein
MAEPFQVLRETIGEYHFKQLLQSNLQLLFCGRIYGRDRKNTGKVHGI